MRALPALLLSTYVFILLLTMAPCPFSWAHAPATLRMGECARMFISVKTVQVQNQVHQSKPVFHVCLLPAAILDDQSLCGRGERLALALAREHVNSLMESSSHSRVEVDVYELKNDSQYTTTDTSEFLMKVEP